MSMEHKAFVFNYEAFEIELKEILEISLDRNEIEGLEDFIALNIECLTDPCEGEPLLANWHETLEYIDSHQYGDLAMTKFYNPNEDIGLSYDWMKIEDTLSSESDKHISILGYPIGKNDNYFDPGKMGSYFQSLKMVLNNKNNICDLIRSKPSYTEILAPVISMFDLAIGSNQGLYITF